MKKQCDFIIRYRSEKKGEVGNKYLTSKMFGHTSADHLKTLVVEVMDECELDEGRLSNLSMDGPNINKSLHNKYSSYLEEKYNTGLIPFNSCPLHKCHNGFHKGILIYGKDVESLAFNLHAWFKIAPCKREDFMEVAAELQSTDVFVLFSRNEALFYRYLQYTLKNNILRLLEVYLFQFLSHPATKLRI